MTRPAPLLATLALMLVGGCDQHADEAPIAVSVIGARTAFADPSSGPMPPVARVLTGAVSQGLVGFDAVGGIQPALAERWIVIDDGRSVIFRLGTAHWPDGSLVTAEDVVRSIERARASRGRNPLSPFLTAIDEAVAMTPQVVEVRLRRSRPDLLKLFAQPELAITRRGQPGSGPFRIRRARDAALHLDRIADESADEDAARTTTRERVLVRAERAASAIVRFTAARSDLVLGGGLTDWPLVAAANVPAATVRIDHAAGLFGLVVARREGLLATPAGRGAVAMVIDRAALTDAFRPDWAPRETLLPEALDSARPPTASEWAAIPPRDRLEEARARVAAYGQPVLLRIALPEGPGARFLWNHLRPAFAAAGIGAERVGERDPSADLRLIDAVAPYDSARWYLRTACQPCATFAAAAIMAARDAPDLPSRAARLAEADAAMAADAGFIPLAGPLRWSLVAARLDGWAANPRAWHPLNHLRERTK